MSFIQEFKEFAMKGNVVDLAVGVIIGGAFQKIVDSLVKDLLMPVSVAVIIHYLTLKMRELDLDWRLSTEEYNALLVRWMANNVKGGVS